MLTRFHVRGFKNLADVDVRFGPFTCIAGPNGVGKSNLFDAILFLSATADRPLLDAARRVRDEMSHSTDVRSLFLQVGDSRVPEMSFEVEMLIPPEGEDELGQRAKASITFMKYKLVLRLEGTDNHLQAERLVVLREELTYIPLGEALKHLGFPHQAKWRRSVATGRRVGEFVSTEDDQDVRTIKLHQDGKSGRPRKLRADTLPRTVLSSTNALESPTALLAKREMQSWRLLQLEPSALRLSDPFSAPHQIGADGTHLAATLYYLAHANGRTSASPGDVYSRVANRVSELVEDVAAVDVEMDRQRELFTLRVQDRRGTQHAARALSDGTLRFLALAILELDPQSRGLLCFEEPENGIHPARVEAMLRLLKDLCVDTDLAVGPENPLRQVIVNTHSPSVVQLVDDDDLLVAQPSETFAAGQRCRGVSFSWLSETWRARMLPGTPTTSRGTLGPYLNPVAVAAANQPGHADRRAARRVKDRPDLQIMLPWPAEKPPTKGS
jgi:predicted ATPase